MTNEDNIRDVVRDVVRDERDELLAALQEVRANNEALSAATAEAVAQMTRLLARVKVLEAKQLAYTFMLPPYRAPTFTGL